MYFVTGVLLQKDYPLRGIHPERKDYWDRLSDTGAKTCNHVRKKSNVSAMTQIHVEEHSTETRINVQAIRMSKTKRTFLSCFPFIMTILS